MPGEIHLEFPSHFKMDPRIDLSFVQPPIGETIGQGVTPELSLFDDSPNMMTPDPIVADPPVDQPYYIVDTPKRSGKKKAYSLALFIAALVAVLCVGMPVAKIFRTSGFPPNAALSSSDSSGSFDRPPDPITEVGLASPQASLRRTRLVASDTYVVTQPVTRDSWWDYHVEGSSGESISRGYQEAVREGVDVTQTQPVNGASYGELESLLPPTAQSVSHLITPQLLKVKVFSLPKPMQAILNPVGKWGLPGVETAERSFPESAMRGKALLAQSLRSQKSRIPLPNADTYEAMGALANVISSGASDSLIGLEIRLKVKRIWQFTSGPVPVVLKVTGFLGSGATNSLVQVESSCGRQRFAMRILSSRSRGFKNETAAEESMKKALALETESMIQACGEGLPEDAAHDRGIAVPIYTAEIEDVPHIISSGRVLVFKDVLLMERLYGDLAQELGTFREMPSDVKEYISRRILLEVLHLQEAGISHNDIKWGNFFLREDGSFLLGDFGSATKFDKRLDGSMTGVTPEYGEPNLLIDFHNYLVNGDMALPDRKSDMWTLGTLLYQIHMGGAIPYNTEGSDNSLDSMRHRADRILAQATTPKKLTVDMRRAGVPLRWQQLICRLLEPHRPRRISAREVAEEFKDLLLD